MISFLKALWLDLTAPTRERRLLDEYTVALRRDQDERIEQWRRRRAETRETFGRVLQ